MDMPKPTEAHARLKRLLGEWTGPEKMSPSPWDPKGGTATGNVQNRLALDGMVVVQEYAQMKGGAVTYRGHGVFSWDAESQTYGLHWFDSMGMPPNAFRGRFEGTALTMTCDHPQGKHRVVFDLAAEGRYGFRMDMSQDGIQWMTMMEGSYARKAAKAAAKAAGKPRAKSRPKASAKARPKARPKKAAKGRRRAR